MNQTPSSFEKINNWIRNSISFKISSIAILILLLLIPSSMVKDMIRERSYRQGDAEREVSAKWGAHQTLTGPILTVPYVEHKYEKQQVVTLKKYAHFLPNDLKINGETTPHIRYRGIFEVVLYSADLSIKGDFDHPDFSNWKIAEEDILWDEASISVGVSDLRGLKEVLKLNWNGRTKDFGAGIESPGVIQSGLSVPINLKDSIRKKHHFAFDLNLNGSGSLNFIPVGKESAVNLSSKWKDPSFTGHFLPDERKVDENGFKATWKVLHLNRNFPQQWIGNAYNLMDASFGVELIVGVNQYQKNTRSAKYAVLIIALTFILFFFMEVINKKRIHPLQYLLVGFALCIFYSLLLSISEHVNFGMAYSISSAAVIALIAIYVKGMLKSWKLSGFLTGSLTIIYGFIFIILQLQDYALLMGSVGLFTVLAVIMYYTRNIDWYNISGEKSEEKNLKE